jgi:hypothetical protein
VSENLAVLYGRAFAFPIEESKAVMEGSLRYVELDKGSSGSLLLPRLRRRYL